MANRILRFKTSDDEIFEVKGDVMLISGTVNNILECCDETDATEIPFPDISGRTFKKVVEFCQHYSEFKPEEESRVGYRKTELTERERSFCDVDLGTLIDVINASNYLDINPLLTITTKFVASLVSGKTPDEIKSLFGVNRDFTPEEIEKVRRDNPWMVDK